MSVGLGTRSSAGPGRESGRLALRSANPLLTRESLFAVASAHVPPPVLILGVVQPMKLVSVVV
jgi:hypothetical protein